MARSPENQERLDAELSLLEAMYPDCINFNHQTEDLAYEVKPQPGGRLVLRIPASYPECGRPDLITASDASKIDLHTEMRTKMTDLFNSLSEGEEVLDTLLATFQELLIEKEKGDASESAVGHQENNDSSQCHHGQIQPRYKTVVIWLHHLLATSKRKLAISPNSVTGLSKPGYPGVLVFSGSSEAVDAHVAELKAQRWQGWQVRFEKESDSEDAVWKFAHGNENGVKEVESMAELVAGLLESQHKEVLMGALGIR